MGDEVLTAANSEFDCYQESLFRQVADFFPRKKTALERAFFPTPQ
jgi:hypothetical protein